MASPQIEGQWLLEALRSTRRNLEQKTAKARRKAQARRAARPERAVLLPAACGDDDVLAAAVPSTVSQRLTAEQRA